MRNTLILMVFLLLVAGIALAASAAGEKKEEGAKTYYTCPMHPEVKSDKPGKCTKCGMEMKKVEEKEEEGGGEKGGECNDSQGMEDSC